MDTFPYAFLIQAGNNANNPRFQARIRETIMASPSTRQAGIIAIEVAETLGPSDFLIGLLYENYGDNEAEIQTRMKSLGNPALKNLRDTYSLLRQKYKDEHKGLRKK